MLDEILNPIASAIQTQEKIQGVQNVTDFKNLLWWFVLLHCRLHVQNEVSFSSVLLLLKS